jgi:hypothetical protein
MKDITIPTEVDEISTEDLEAAADKFDELVSIDISKFYDEESINQEFNVFIKFLNKFRDGDRDPNRKEYNKIHSIILTFEKAVDEMKEVYEQH